MAGTVGAIFNSALQLGSAVGSAAVTSIMTSVENKRGKAGYYLFNGRAAAFWFMLAVVVVEAISVLTFYKPSRMELGEDEIISSSSSSSSSIGKDDETDLETQACQGLEK